MLRDLWMRMRAVFRRKVVEAELDDELRFHLERQIEKHVRGGLTREEARRRARVELGGLEQAKEECREARGTQPLETLIQDVRYGLRVLGKAPGFTALAVMTLALGVGANAAIFSLVNGVLLQPLPFPESNQLAAITDGYPEGALEFMRGDFRSIRVAGYRMDQGMNLSGDGPPIRVEGDAVSANLFSVLGAHAELGRTFQSGEDQPGKDDLVILSHSLWLRQFHGDAGVLGEMIAIEGRPRRIVGVMPARFSFGSSKAELWIPLHLDPRAAGDYWGTFLSVIGRLRRGATLEQSEAELHASLPRMRKMFPWKMPDALWAGSTVVSLRESLVGSVREKLLILLGAVSLVLLIACANVANLLLARAVTRQKEIAVRAALGAGNWRICRQLITESLLLGLAGGGLGVLGVVAGLPLLKTILPADTPRLAGVAVDWRVVAFAGAAAILSGMLFGLPPAFHVLRVDLNQSLKTGQRRSSAAHSQRLRTSLAVSEIALAVVLVIAAGLLVRSLWKLSRVDPGFRPESVLTARITPSATFCSNWARCRQFFDELLRGVRALPGVSDAALVNDLPLSGQMQFFAASLEGHPQDPREPAPVLFESVVTPDYFRAMGIPLLEGRGLTAGDMTAGAPSVALVTASTARKFWPNQNPIGKHIKREWLSNWTTVVGVVGDVQQQSLASRLPDYVDGAVYEPYVGNSRVGIPLPTQMTLVLRTPIGPATLGPELKNLVASLNADVPVTQVRRLKTVVTASEAAPSSTMSLFAIFAGLALVLGSIGIYGVISYSVTQRMPEIGMRLALGAQRSDVFRLVMGQGARMAFVGVAIGVAAALVANRLMSSLLFGVGAADPLTYLAVPALFALVALAACYVPARRAMRVDPVVALRHE